MGWSHIDAPALARGLISDIHADLEARVAARDKQLAAYNQLLAELADRLTGGALEEQRRIDPTTPARWQAADWQAFFAQQPLTPAASGATWGGAPTAESQRAHDRAEIERLRAQVQQLQQALQVAQSAPTVSAVVKEVPRMTTVTLPAMPTNGLSLTLDEILAELAALAQQLPGPPLTFRSRVADPINSAQAWRRQVQTLYLVARHGFSQSILVDTVLARLEGQELRGGARGKQFERLIKVNLLESSKLSIDAAIRRQTWWSGNSPPTGGGWRRRCSTRSRSRPTGSAWCAAIKATSRLVTRWACCSLKCMRGNAGRA